jgi:putative spermidine/putrescine transport system permease protein
MSGTRLTGFQSLAGSIRYAGTRGRTTPRRMPGWLVSWLQAGPLAIVLLLLFFIPMLLFLAVSFFDYDRVGIYPAFIFDSYHDVFTNPATYEIYLDSLRFAVITCGITLVLGIAIAQFLIFHIRSSLTRTVLFLLCAIPFWTSAIIRTIAWIPLLGREGAFNQLLMALRITDHPLSFLLFSNFAVILAYVHQLTLLVVGPVANSMGKIDPAVLEAATDAGASRWQIMRNVILPLSKTGIMLGLVLVFTQVMGDFFIIQQMSGGQSGSVVSELSTEIQAMQYPPAAASAMVLVLVVAVFVGGAMRVVDVRKELAS